MRKPKQSGFTLIELIIVMTIIVILAGVVLVNLGPRREQAARARALSDIKEMDTALELYHADNGYYPTTQQGVQALITQPSSPPLPRNWQGPYLKNKTSVPLDSWGNPYLYTSPGEVNPTSFDLYSYGADGKKGGSGNDTDVTPWDQ